MELINPELVAVVVTACTGIFSYMPPTSKHFKRAFAIVLGGAIGLGGVSDLSSIQLVLEGLGGGLLAGFQATFSVALVQRVADKSASTIEYVEEEPLELPV